MNASLPEWAQETSTPRLERLEGDVELLERIEGAPF
jgi:hypothetical protein